MVITSPDIHINKIEEYSFSNGNCELLTVEIPTTKQAVIVLYRPSGKNQSLEKFTQVINLARKYLHSKQNSPEIENFILCGDFNFNSKIVNWRKTSEGLIAHYAHGTSVQHRHIARPGGGV